MRDELNDVQKDIEAYLVEQVDTGKQYFKSKYIADDLDLTSKTVGTNLGFLQERTDRISIESWSGGSSGRTWLIRAGDDTDDSTDTTDQQVAVLSDN